MNEKCNTCSVLLAYLAGSLKNATICPECGILQTIQHRTASSELKRLRITCPVRWLERDQIEDWQQESDHYGNYDKYEGLALGRWNASILVPDRGPPQKQYTFSKKKKKMPFDMCCFMSSVP